MPRDRIALGEKPRIVVVRVFLALHVHIRLEHVEQLDGGGMCVEINAIDAFQRAPA